MKTRDAVLDYQYVAKDTETYKKDLSLVEPISAIEIEVECTNGATSNKANFISDIVTKIEVVDGSEVLHSLNMSQLEAMHFYKTGKMPKMMMGEWGGGGQRHNCLLMFGRYLWDRDYAFNAKSFKNPKLNITFNKAAIRAAGVDGFAAGDNIKLTTVAKVFEDVPAPAQFLMAKQIENFTSVASGEKRIEFPTDYTYRMILTRFWKQVSDIQEIIKSIKLTCDTDKVIPFNRQTEQLDGMALSLFGLGRIKHDVLVKNAAHVRLVFNKEPLVQGHFNEANITDFLNVNAPWSSDWYIFVYDKAGSVDTSDRQYTAMEEGHAPHACLPIVFGRPGIPEDWFDPTVYKKIELVLDQGVAGAVCEIAAEQVRKQ
jgi:hypothetical protein